MVGPSGPNHSARINQLLPFELFKGEAGERTVIDEEDDDAGAGERVGKRDEFRPALQSLRQSGHVRLDGEYLQSSVGEMNGDLDRRRFAEIIHVRLEGETETGDNGILTSGGTNLGDDMMRLRVVDLAGGA